MLERLEGLPTGVDGLRASGRITREEYDAVILALFEEARREGRRIRLLAEFGPDFVGVSPDGAWEGLRIGVHHLRRVERCAVVSDNEWIRLATRIKASVSFLFSCSIELFHAPERTAALQFLTAPAERPPMRHRLIPGTGVLMLEPEGPLRVEDFEAVAAEVDPWIESRGPLRGVVVHVRQFPGWEDLGGLISHLRFVRDHQRMVRRVALVTDAPLADVAQKLASHFAAANVKHFPFDDAGAALLWAEGDDAASGNRAKARGR